METAARVSQLSEVTAAMGERDMAQGEEMLETSENITALGQAVRLLSADELQHGLALAGLAGQLATASDVVDSLAMPVLAEFLSRSSRQLRGLAVDDLLRARGTRELAQEIRRSGSQVASFGSTEMAEGLLRMAASKGFADESVAMASTGAEQVAEGLAELALAQGAKEAAQTLAQETAE